MEVETIKERLKSLGYECVDGDDFALNFLIQKVEQYIKHFCNITEVPACLEHVWVDKVVGEFLQTKRATGQLTSLQFEQLVKSIRDGDTTVEYNNSYTNDPETLFQTLIAKLTNDQYDQLIAHRRLKW